MPTESSSPAEPRHRRGRAWLGLAFAVGGTAVAGAMTPPETLARTATAQLGRLALFELARAARLRDESNEPMGAPLAVRIEQRGGPLWVRPTMHAVAQADAVVAVDEHSSRVLAVEAVANERYLALVLHLWRQGWELRNPWPLHTGLVPQLAITAAMVGAGVALVARRMAWGWLAAGVLGQLGAFALQWFSPEVLSGPWWARNAALREVVELARVTPDAAILIVAMVVVLSGIVLPWDHFRSRRTGTALTARAVAAMTIGGLGAVIWFEAATRIGLWPWLAMGWGWLGIGSLGLAWSMAAWGGRRAT